MARIKAGYEVDEWFRTRRHLKKCVEVNGFWMCEGQILVPNVDTLRVDIIRALHSPPASGHIGRIRTIEILRRTFRWNGLGNDVATFIGSCHQCQTNKASNQKPGGLLLPVEIPDGTWDCVSMDLITALPTSRLGNDAIAVFVDKLSKMVHIAPCTTKIGAEEFAKLFMHEVHRHHGLPKKIVSDRDARFTGTFLKEVTRILGIKQALSTAFHPQSDGQTERVNRILEDMLRHYVSPYHDDWDDLLDVAEFAINNAFQASIKSTPFFVVFGKHPNTPMTLEISTKVPRAGVWAKSYNERVEVARAAILAAQQRQILFADRSRRDVKYILGQEVLLSTRNIKFKGQGTPKFLPKWIGPLRIKTLVEPRGADGKVDEDRVRAVELQLPPLMRLHPVFHVSLVKPYLSDGQARQVMPLEFDDDGAPKWEVETLLDSRGRSHGRGKSVKEFLVRWKGFGPEHDSWEPRDNIQCPTLIEDFDRRTSGVVDPEHRPGCLTRASTRALVEHMVR
jgi:hypothetical protein